LSRRALPQLLLLSECHDAGYAVCERRTSELVQPREPLVQPHEPLVRFSLLLLPLLPLLPLPLGRQPLLSPRLRIQQTIRF
jgi:hypothetical protein